MKVVPKQVAQAVAAIKEEQIEKSPIKEKTCADIFEEYQTVVKAFIESGDEEKLKPLFEWSNDPFFNDCRANTDFKTKFDEWEEMMNEVE